MRDNASSSGIADPLAQGALRVETPEQVALELPLAGPGSRFAALCLDFLVILLFGLGAALTLIVIGVGLSLAGVIGEEGWLRLALVGIAVQLLLTWGYFAYFEARRDGVTPGKKRLGLRVVRDDGGALGVEAALIRNLVRIIDLQPVITGLLGGLSMVLHPRAKRLGDLAAGTIVVRDLPSDFPPLVNAPAQASGDVVGAPRLSDADHASLETFLARAGELAPARRRELTRAWAGKLGVQPGGGAASDTRTLDLLADWMAEENLRRLGAAAGGRGAAARQLVRRRQARWEALRGEIQHLRKRGRLAALGEERVAAFAAAHRAASADLARARTLGVGTRTRWALERLVASGHLLLHRARPTSWRRVLRFFTHGLAELVQRRRGVVWLSAAAFFLPGLAVFVAMRFDPSLEPLFVPAGFVERAELAAADPTLDYRDTFEEGAWSGDVLAGFVTLNNVRVAFTAFAAGILLGLGSLFVLVFNGLHLGSAMASFVNRGAGTNLLAWVAPHGPFELFAVVLAGAGGIWLGGAIWHPGRLSRARALVERGRESFGLLGGAVALLLLAGPLEGFVAPARVPDGVKYAVGLACVVLLALYFARPRAARAD